MGEPLNSLRAWAMTDDAVTQAVACAGTALESTTFAVNKKAFLFIQPKADGVVLRFKLSGSLDDAKRRGCVVGATGWVTLSVAGGPPPGFVQAWIAESRAVVGGASKSASAKAGRLKAGRAKPKPKRGKGPSPSRRGGRAARGD